LEESQMSGNHISLSQFVTAPDITQLAHNRLSYQQIFLQYQQIFANCFIPPLFILPSFFTDIKCENFRLSSTPPKTKPGKKNAPTEPVENDIPLPQVDPIATAYANSYVAVQFSLRFIKYLTNPANNIKLLIADNQYSKEALAYYKSKPLNIKQLDELLVCEERKYRRQLKQVTFTTKSKTANGAEREHTLNLTQKQIDDVIKLAKTEVDKNYLDRYFQQARAVIIQNGHFTEKDYTPEELVNLPEIKAMLDVLVYSEGTGAGYGTIVKGTVKSAPFNPELVGKTNVSITDFSRHPQILVAVTGTGKDSTAAGRYQFLYKTWQYYGGDTKDFTPRSQDLIAVYAFIKRKMVASLLAGDVKKAINTGAPEWASLPMSNGKSYHGQPVKSIEELIKVYNDALANYRK
jgi:muramidase (phage lysozyme)